MLTDQDKQVAHNIIARLFDRPVRDMGGGLKIVSLKNSWMPAEERDLIVSAMRKMLNEK